MIIDSRAHLHMPQFDRDRAEVIQRARDAGLELLVTIGTGNPEQPSIQKTLELVENHDFLYAGLGIHPHDAGLANHDYWKQIERWADHPKVVLWGEIGLDYFQQKFPRQTQQEVFRRQLRIARERDLPVSIHCRNAWPDLIAILKQEWTGKRCGGVLHGFRGSRADAWQCVSMGFLIGFSGIITYESSGSLREVARGLRLDQMLVETDSPRLAPVPHRGSRNEPAYVVDVARSLAEIIGVTFEDIARNSTRNFRRLINRPAPTNEVLAYAIRDRLYINLTNRCTARCLFCARETAPVAGGYDLRLEREHDADEYIEAVGDPQRYGEVVFCGFGEPTLRLAELLKIARVLKSKGGRLRLNTNGHGNLIHGRNIVPDLATYLDEVSVSLNSPDAAAYDRVVRPDFGASAFHAVLDFIAECVAFIPKVTVTAVDLPRVDLEACRRLAQGLGAEFRAREYQVMVGSTDFTKP